MLPKRIFLPEAFLMLINPTIFLMFVFASVLVVLQFPLLALLPLILLMIPETRVYLIELFQNNFVALLALVEIAGGKRSVIWTKAEDSRKNFDADILRSRGLIK
jgi:hypothetical protein